MYHLLYTNVRLKIQYIPYRYLGYICSIMSTDSAVTHRVGFRFEPEIDFEDQASENMVPLNTSDDEKENGQPEVPNHMNNMLWCSCSNCSLMSSNLENICCTRVAAVNQKMESHKCITFSSSFAKLCLDIEVLELLLTSLNDFYGRSTNNHLSNRYAESSFFSFLFPLS